MSIDSDKEALENFLLDINCLDKLEQWAGKFDLFDVLKISRAEIRHSNILAWLLAPNETHGLGDKFIKKIFQKISQTGKYKKQLLKLLLADFYSFTVHREWDHIDILLLSDSEKILIAIENKIGSHEHDNQLSRYKENLQKQYPDYQIVLVYLTPNGEAPSDDDWELLTYEDILNGLKEIKKNVELLPDVNLLIENYIYTIRRNVVEDQELISICNKIYKKHKKALDLIFEYKSDNKQYAEYIRKALSELSQKQDIIYSDKDGNNSYIPFYTADMNAILPNLDNNTKGSWGDEHVYRFCFSPLDKKAYFELGGLNVPPATQEKMNQIIDKLAPNKNANKKFTFKRIYSFEFDLPKDEEDEEDRTKKLVKNIVKKLLKRKDEIIKIFNSPSE